MHQQGFHRDDRSRSARGVKRAVLGALALSVLAAPAVSSGCAASFDPPNRISTLRVLTITADKPYVNVVPEDAPDAEETNQVTLRMTYHDGYETEEGAAARPVQVLWLGCCYNPPLDQYFGCYEQLAEAFEDLSGSVEPGEIPMSDCLGLGDTFTLKIPDDIVSSRPKPDVGPHYGIAYAFFAVCAGSVGPVPPDGTGRAPDFPLGCFDEAGNRLGSESFVPGYTQIYSFADGRINQNPVLQGVTLDGKDISKEFEEIPTVKACPISDEDRRTPSCDSEDVSDCRAYTLKALIDPSVAEIDPDATGEDGGQLTETMWVSYFTDSGDISPGIKLVNDAVAGFNPDLEVTFIPPAEPGVTTIWVVLRDARGGSSVEQRLIRVE